MKGILERMRDNEPIFSSSRTKYKEKEIVFFTGPQGQEQFEKAMKLWKK